MNHGGHERFLEWLLKMVMAALSELSVGMSDTPEKSNSRQGLVGAALGFWQGRIGRLGRPLISRGAFHARGGVVCLLGPPDGPLGLKNSCDSGIGH